MFETNAKGESEWRVALFRCLEKAKTLLVLPETVFALLLLLLCFVFSLFALLHKGLRMFEKNAFYTTSLHLLSLTKNTDQKMPNPKKIFSQKSPHNLASHHHHHHERDIKRTREELFRAFQRERV